MKNLTITLIAALTLLVTNGYAQSTFTNLYFNSYDNILRLDFSTGSPVQHYNGIVGGEEGINHQEDATGKVMFWVKGNGIYDANDTLMPGYKPGGGFYTSQSVAEIAICPFPTTPGKYYIIYAYDACSWPTYSIVDMNLRGGLGDVIIRNDLMDTLDISEGIEVVKVPGGGYRVLAYACDSGLCSFEVSDTGFGKGQMLYKVTPKRREGRNEVDYYKGKLGMSYNDYGDAAWGDYDVASNTFTNGLHIQSNGSLTNGFYGLEFSPDRSKVYIGAWYQGGDNLFQYDATTGTLLNKWFLPAQSTKPPDFGPGIIELGPDNKLYVPAAGSNTLYVINNPDSLNAWVDSIVVNCTLSFGVSEPMERDIATASPMHEKDNGLIILAGEQLRFKDLAPNAALSIYNTLGQQLYYVKNYRNNFPLHSLPQGIYFYRVTEAGGEVYTGKFSAK